MPEGGTEVRMLFAGERDGKRLFTEPAKAAPEQVWTDGLSGDAVVSLSPVSFVGGVLGRLARALAAKARFSLDRFSDVYLVTDAIAAHAARAASGERISFGISTDVRRLELTVGPFRDGAGEWLNDHAAAQDADGALAMLSDEVVVRPVGPRRGAARGDARPPPGGPIAVGLGAGPPRGRDAQLPSSSSSGTSVSVSRSATPVSVSSR